MHAFPNPSTSYFVIKIESKDEKTPVTVRVINISGKEVEVRRNVVAGQTLQLGNNYFPGIYIVEVRQGEKRMVTKLIKQGD
jgi:Secretion system C-terminal sorting domain